MAAVDDPADDGTDGTTAGWRARVAARSAEPARARATARAVGHGTRLVEATGELMTERGGTSFTVQEVARQAGVSLTTLYAHFAGKDELLLAVFDEAIQTGARVLARHVKHIGDPVDRLRTMIRDPIVLVAAAGGHMALIGREQVRLAELFPGEVREAIAPLVRMLHAEIRAAEEAGAAHPGDAYRAAELIYGIIGTQLQTLHLGWNDDAEGMADSVWEFCARALGIVEPGGPRSNGGTVRAGARERPRGRR